MNSPDSIRVEQIAFAVSRYEPPDKMGDPCQNCGLRPSKNRWGDALTATHGGEQLWCDVCVLTVQLNHARERAAAIPELERRLSAAIRQPVA